MNPHVPILWQRLLHMLEQYEREAQTYGVVVRSEIRTCETSLRPWEDCPHAVRAARIAGRAALNFMAIKAMMLRGDK